MRKILRILTGLFLLAVLVLSLGFWCAAVARQTCWAVDCSFVCVGRIARFDGGVKALFEPVWTLGNRAPSQPGC
jgi:hypothetical protein